MDQPDKNDSPPATRFRNIDAPPHLKLVGTADMTTQNILADPGNDAAWNSLRPEQGLFWERGHLACQIMAIQQVLESEQGRADLAALRGTKKLRTWTWKGHAGTWSDDEQPTTAASVALGPLGFVCVTATHASGAPPVCVEQPLPVAEALAALCSPGPNKVPAADLLHFVLLALGKEDAK